MNIISRISEGQRVFSEYNDVNKEVLYNWLSVYTETSGYDTWFTAGGAIRIAHYDVIDDVITRKL